MNWDPIFDHVDREIRNKIIVAVALAIAGTIVVLVRKTVARVDRKSAGDIAKRALRSATFAAELIESLDIPYGMRDAFPEAQFDHLVSVLRAAKRVGSYEIVGVVSTYRYKVLVLTEYLFTDFAVSYHGRPTDVNRKAYHQFVLCYDRDQQNFSVLSNIYSNTEQKFQKEGFMENLFNSPISS